MDLNELKDIWIKEKKALENKVIVNEKLVTEMVLGKTKGKFNELLGVSIVGRNLALVYMVISLWLAFKANDLAYSMPAIIGAAAMLLSFIQHRHLKKPDFASLSTVELQKAIWEFKIHTTKYAKYDLSIVCLWIITLTPAYVKVYFDTSIYSSNDYVLIFSGVALAVIFLIYIFSRTVYQKWEKELEESASQLDSIKEFERS